MRAAYEASEVPQWLRPRFQPEGAVRDAKTSPSVISRAYPRRGECFGVGVGLKSVSTVAQNSDLQARKKWRRRFAAYPRP